jgi:hypothetical protein
MAIKRTTNKFQGEIVVASRIVDYLSSGLYESPAACLKELINNSYDADATEVRIFVQPDADRIIISDDGHGMNRSDFIKNFSRISETYKRSRSQYTDKGRPKIGKIGIGFIAANEICDIMEIESTKKGSTELIHVKINFAKMRGDLDSRRRSKDDIAKGDYEGEVLRTDRDAHYTTIFLRSVRGEAKNILVGAMPSSGYAGKAISLYGKNDVEISAALKDPAIMSWSDFDPYSETLLHVALNIPVRYHHDWMPAGLRSKLADFTAEVEALGFSVYYDGTDLKKPVVFTHNRPDAFVERLDYTGTNVSAKGYFYIQHGTLRPQDLHGVLIRIRHAAVGGYDSSFMSYPTSRGPLFQRWVSAEIWASDQLEDAMNIDRRTLRVSHPAYVELQHALHDKLTKVLAKTRQELYQTRSERRREEKAGEYVREVSSAIGGLGTKLDAGAVKRVEYYWRQSQDDPDIRKALLRKYTVAELYEVILEVAEAELPPGYLSRFLEALTKRLASGSRGQK